MNLDVIIHDLKAFIDYFDKETGSVPVCMEEAIKVLEALKVIKGYMV